MRVSVEQNRIRIDGLKDFSLEQCLLCGQAFRWRRSEAGFAGVALGCAVTARLHGQTLTIDGAGQAMGQAFLRYFDLERDYGAIKRSYADDDFLAQGMAFAGGMRVLRQPVFETLISFIVSANNNVGRITGIVDRLCRRFGEEIGEDAHDFPTPQALAGAEVGDILACGAGYRAKYIADTARMVADGFDLDGLEKMPYEQARQKLTELPGVGLKVADCVALYGLGFLQAFPADVWMKRVLCGVYGYAGSTDKQLRAFVDEMFGENAGIAQQYLFHYARRNPQGVCKSG